MPPLRTIVYSKAEDLPQGLSEENFFHSRSLFMLSRQTPRHKPYMVVTHDGDGNVLAQMLALVRYRTSWFPPYLYLHCRVLGEGVYHPAEGLSRSELFAMMMQQLTSKLGRRMLYIEVSNLSQKMFGYKVFRDCGFFPVRWMSIHNSLHSRTPEERIGPRLQKHIDHAYARGVVTTEVEGDEDFAAFMRLLRKHNRLKPKRYVPHDNFFRGIKEQGKGRLYITHYHQRAIGCSAVVYSGAHESMQNNAYLWYAAFRRKSFAWLHPDELTIWHAIKDAHQRGYDHICFLDVGLPFRKNRYRDFILKFGGKPTSTYRWFRTSIGWLNKLLSWYYRD
ncbi:MAG: GNAT family N-acetyltransferase [Prevotella sp.]|nr:GNAT family N-acetyltransferase [Prevotella sp.]